MGRKRKSERKSGEECGKLSYIAHFKPKNNKQEDLFNSILENTLTLAIGPPGTAKTYVSCVAALKALKLSNIHKKIYLVKSVTTLEGEDIGFLKGGLQEKMEPFMFSFYHNFSKIIGKEHTNKLFVSKIIEVLPMAYLRGINIDNAIVIFDEAQNVSQFNMRTLMTRIGETSKLIILGDTRQVDLKRKKLSVLRKIFNMTKGLNSTNHIEFTNEEIVRSKLVQDIDILFEEHFPSDI